MTYCANCGHSKFSHFKSWDFNTKQSITGCFKYVKNPDISDLDEFTFCKCISWIPSVTDTTLWYEIRFLKGYFRKRRLKNMSETKKLVMGVVKKMTKSWTKKVYNLPVKKKKMSKKAEECSALLMGNSFGCQAGQVHRLVEAIIGEKIEVTNEPENMMLFDLVALVNNGELFVITAPKNHKGIPLGGEETNGKLIVNKSTSRPATEREIEDFFDKISDQTVEKFLLHKAKGFLAFKENQ